MKNLLFALIVANILYFLWGMYTEKTPEPGVDIVAEAELGPPLELRTGDADLATGSVGAVLGSGDARTVQTAGIFTR